MTAARIAILGATSHLAKDLIMELAREQSTQMMLFARRPDAVAAWATAAGLGNRFPVCGYDEFGSDNHDAIINFVGAGDPARAAHMGRDIFDVTAKFDDLALNYLRRRPDCRYLFLSSGAVYGGTFAVPADATTPTVHPSNDLSPQEFYGAAKFHAECRHRALIDRPIIDIRVFNYFSRTSDVSSGFFIANVLRAIRENHTLETTSESMVRDFLHPRDFRALVGNLLKAPPMNCAIDCYSLAPIDKHVLLSEMQARFDLRYTATSQRATHGATGIKQNYYSLDRRAASFGYQPQYSSMQCIVEETEALLGLNSDQAPRTGGHHQRNSYVG